MGIGLPDQGVALPLACLIYRIEIVRDAGFTRAHRKHGAVLGTSHIYQLKGIPVPGVGLVYQEQRVTFQGLTAQRNDISGDGKFRLIRLNTRQGLVLEVQHLPVGHPDGPAVQGVGALPAAVVYSGHRVAGHRLPVHLQRRIVGGGGR